MLRRGGTARCLVGFPLGIRGILDFVLLLQCFGVLSLAARSSSSTNPAAQNQYVALSQLFRDQTVALLNLPPLAEFENFLRSRFRGTRDPASTFVQLQTEWRVEPQFWFHPASARRSLVSSQYYPGKSHRYRTYVNIPSIKITSISHLREHT